jgi:hypothetical protein
MIALWLKAEAKFLHFSGAHPAPSRVCHRRHSGRGVQLIFDLYLVLTHLTHTFTAYTGTPLLYETVCNANTIALCDVTPCSLVERYGSLKRIFCLAHKCNTRCEQHPALFVRAAPILKLLVGNAVVCTSTQLATCSPLTEHQSATSATQGTSTCNLSSACRTVSWLVLSMTSPTVIFLSQVTPVMFVSQIRLLGIFSKSGGRSGQPSALVSENNTQGSCRHLRVHSATQQNKHTLLWSSSNKPAQNSVVEYTYSKRQRSPHDMSLQAQRVGGGLVPTRR